MLTSKQSFAALATLLILVGLYQVYDLTFGRFTDYEQLSTELAAPIPEERLGKPQLPERREVEIAAIRGFGAGCKELRAPIKIESRKKIGREAIAGRGVGMFIYAVDYEINPGGNNPKQIRVHPFSLVNISPKEGGTAAEDEILTCRGDEAILEFDRPVEPTKLSGLKPIAGWVQAAPGLVVELTSNRRTEDVSDDIMITTERLDFRESRNLIWANDWIRLSEQEATITGVGMELELYPKPEPGEPKPKHDARRIRLFKQVRFDLLVEDDENFLDTGIAGKADPAKGDKKNTSPMTITARGPFLYDLEAEQAFFNKSVQVIHRPAPTKPGDDNSINQLDCDQLVLQFRPKPKSAAAATAPPAPPAASGPSANRNMHLQTVTATGEEVILLSDSQRLYATGNYLFYDSDDKRVILKAPGEMIAIHDNTEIHGRSLVIKQEDGKSISNMSVDGPNGWMRIDDEPPGPDGPSESGMKVRWQGRLELVKEPKTELQVVTITDGVELEDEMRALKSDRLKVWFESVERDSPPRAQPGAAKPSGKKLEPIRLQANGRVSAHSEDLAVVTDELTMSFEKKKGAPGPKPAGGAKQVEAVKPAEGARPLQVAKQADNSQPVSAPPPTPFNAKALKPDVPKTAPAVVAAPKPSVAPKARAAAAKVEAPKPQIEEKPNEEPLDVRARKVTVVVERDGKKSTPVRAWAEGNVLVTQSSAKNPNDAVEIRGHTLHFERKPEGDIVRVGAVETQLATIVTPDLTLAGASRIDLNEITNEIEASGEGYLIIQSDGDLTGKPTSGAKELRIDWKRNMSFNGKQGSFQGNVKAQQGTAEIRCQNMDVLFDRRINFAERHHRRQENKGEKPKIEVVDCDKDVVVFDAVKNGNEIVRYSRLQALELHFDNAHRTTEAKGLGVIRIIEPNQPTKDANGVTTPPKHPYQLTLVRFKGTMRGDEAKKTAKFFDDVHILHTPVDRLAEIPNEDNLNEDGVVIDASRSAEMAVQEEPGGQKYREFQAEENVKVQAQSYWGQCDRLSYDQKKDLLVFDSAENRKAQFYRQEREGDRPQPFIAKTIRYWRTARKVKTEGNEGFQHLEIGAPKKLSAPR